MLPSLWIGSIINIFPWYAYFRVVFWALKLCGICFCFHCVLDTHSKLSADLCATPNYELCTLWLKSKQQGFGGNFVKSWPIFKIISPIWRGMNFQLSHFPTKWYNSCPPHLTVDADLPCETWDIKAFKLAKNAVDYQQCWHLKD